jgi:hypothetical protein
MIFVIARRAIYFTGTHHQVFLELEYKEHRETHGSDLNLGEMQRVS